MVNQQQDSEPVLEFRACDIQLIMEMFWLPTLR